MGSLLIYGFKFRARYCTGVIRGIWLHISDKTVETYILAVHWDLFQCQIYLDLVDTQL